MSIQIASVSTSAGTVRSEIDGWTFEDSSLLVKRAHDSNPHKLFIGYTPSPKNIPHYTTVLEMLADGWELLGPPQREDWTTTDEDDQPPVKHEQWCWWLQRKRQTRSPA